MIHVVRLLCRLGDRSKDVHVSYGFTPGLHNSSITPHGLPYWGPMWVLRKAQQAGVEQDPYVLRDVEMEEFSLC